MLVFEKSKFNLKPNWEIDVDFLKTLEGLKLKGA